MAHHNEIRDGFANLTRKAFTPTHMCDDPKIYTGRAVRGGKDKLKGSPFKEEGEMKGYILTRETWTQGMDSIRDMCVVNTDTAS